MKAPSGRSGLAVKSALVVGGLIVGGVLATTLGAQAATPSTSSDSSSSSTASDPHPGDNGADGVPESQEPHGGGHGRGLGLSGTVTAVTSNTVTIKSSSGTATYSVTSSSDIDKNGEASLSSLAVGDAVTFSVDSTKTTQIDKLHAGDETKNTPNRPGGAGSNTTPQSATPSSSTGA